MIVSPEIEITEDGSPTLRHPVFGDTYHSLRGAEGESAHVFIDNGLKLCRNWGSDEAINILEVGFGSGLNALLTLHAAQDNNQRINYTGIELYPVEEKVWKSLKYTSDANFEAMHMGSWGQRHQITPLFTLEKAEADLVSITFGAIFDLIYFDAFAPDTQPEMWTEGVFRKLFDHTTDGGALVTYSSKGDVKRALRSAGYEVSRLQGALGKRHMLRAVKVRSDVK